VGSSHRGGPSASVRRLAEPSLPTAAASEQAGVLIKYRPARGPAPAFSSRFLRHIVVYGVKSRFSVGCRIWLAADAISARRRTSMTPDFRIISQVFG